MPSGKANQFLKKTLDLPVENFYFVTITYEMCFWQFQHVRHFYDTIDLKER